MQHKIFRSFSQKLRRVIWPYFLWQICLLRGDDVADLVSRENVTCKLGKHRRDWPLGGENSSHMCFYLAFYLILLWFTAT